MPPADPARERILTAAQRLFAERGFAGAATRDIADAAAVNQGLIAYHFGGKEGLFREVVERGLGDLCGALAIDPLPDIDELLLAFAPRGPFLALLAQALLAPGPRREWLLGAPLAPVVAVLRAIAARQRPGGTPPPEPVLLLTFVAGAASLALFGPALESATGEPIDRELAHRAQREALLRLMHADALLARGPWAPKPTG